MNSQSHDLQSAFTAQRHRRPWEILRVVNDRVKSTHDRVAALCSLPHSELTADEKLDALLGLLGDEAARIVYWATVALGELKDVRAIGPLRMLAIRHVSLVVRCNALRTLGQLGDEWIISQCLALVDVEDQTARSLAQAALGDLGTGEALRALQVYLEAQTDPAEQRYVSLLLARHGVDVAQDFLSKSLNTAEDKLDRLMIAAGLANYDNEEGLKALRELVAAWDCVELFKVELIVERFAGVVLKRRGDTRRQVLEWIGTRLAGRE